MSTSISSELQPAHWIGGRRAPGSGAVIEIVNPATGEVIGVVPAGTAADVDAAVTAAMAAFPGWSATPVARRAAVLRRVADGLDRRREEIAQLITAETGSPISLSRGMQLDFPIAHARSVAELSETFPWTERVGSSLVVREPLGVVGAIPPWNFPMIQMMGKVAPALIAGNTIVLKPSQVAPLTAVILGEVAADAGLPAGVLNIVQGEGSVIGDAISRHPDIAMVSFTGSTGAGRLVSVAAADTVKRVGLELGGKSANIILDDADLAQAVTLGLASAWANAGQICAAWSRMLVPADRQDEIVDLLVSAAETFTVGDPIEETTVIGPVVSESARAKIVGFVERAIADGATVAFGGPEAVEGLSGAYVRPTILVGVDPDAEVAQEEIFGPVLAVIAYRDEDEAVAIANNSKYGLAGAVFGSHDRAVAVARRIRTGTVQINDAAPDLRLPFGGYKLSGNGAHELGTQGIEEYTEVKSIQIGNGNGDAA